MENHNGIKKIFEDLYKCECNYLILRNWEDYYEDILIPGHEDIDVLVRNNKDRKKMLTCFGATTRLPRDNGIAYKFLYKGQEISLDIRMVYDGYYDKKWSKSMLNNRVLHHKGFFIMDSEDYYYSLIYHAIYQKPFFSKDYEERLNSFSFTKDMKYNQEGFEKKLSEYMKNKKYWYTIPLDVSVIHNFNSEFVSGRIKYPFLFKIKHKTMRLIEFLRIDENKWNNSVHFVAHIPNMVLKKIIGNVKYDSLKHKIKNDKHE